MRIVIFALGFITICSFAFRESTVSNFSPDKKGNSTKFPKEIIELTGELIYVPGGTFISGLVLDGDTIANARNITCASFYMAKGEVTNWQYRQFLISIKNNYGKDSADKLYPDTTVFIRDIPGEPKDPNSGITKYYFFHATYALKPVVGVSWVQANAYCKWLNKILIVLMSMHPEWQEKYPFGGFHLPTEMEWEYAALGKQLRSEEKCPYSWGYDLFTSKRDQVVVKGNFGEVKDKDGVIVKAFFLGSDYTSSVFAYEPNDYGIKNLSGNVNEWVMDVFRDSSRDDVFYDNDSIVKRKTFRDIDSNNTKLDHKVIKGGGFLDGPAYCLISNRRAMAPDSSRCDVGFRIVMSCVDNSSKN